MYTAKGQLDRDAMIRQHVPLVRRIAHHMIAKLPPNVELDDLIQVGMMGLAEALSRYEVAQGVQFETFATQRIRGAMLDELREGDWMSRSSRKSQKDIEHAVHRLEQKLGRSPLESEIASEMGMSLVEYQSLLGKVRGTQLVYLEDMTHGNEDDDGFLDRHVADADADPLELLRDQWNSTPTLEALSQASVRFLVARVLWGVSAPDEERVAASLAKQVARCKRVAALGACEPEVRLAGGTYIDVGPTEAYVDGTMVSAKGWTGLAAFMRECLKVLGTEIHHGKVLAAAA